MTASRRFVMASLQIADSRTYDAPATETLPGCFFCDAVTSSYAIAGHFGERQDAPVIPRPSTSSRSIRTVVSAGSNTPGIWKRPRCGCRFLGLRCLASRYCSPGRAGAAGSSRSTKTARLAKVLIKSCDQENGGSPHGQPPIQPSYPAFRPNASKLTVLQS